MIIAVSGLTEDEAGQRGSAGAGKDEVADHLVAKHGFVKVALADEIKRIAMRLWDFSENQLWGPSAERNKPDPRYRLIPMESTGRLWSNMGRDIRDLEDQSFAESLPGDAEGPGTFLTPRRALQQIGTEVARAVDPDVWIRYTLRLAKQLVAGECFYNRLVGPVHPAAQTLVKGVVISDVRFPNEIAGVSREGGKNWRKKRSFDVLPGKAASHVSELSLLDTPDSEFDAVLPGGDLDFVRLTIDAVMDSYAGRMVPYDDSQRDVPPHKRK